MKKLNKWQKFGLALAFCAMAGVGSAYAEDAAVTPSTIITSLQASVLGLITLILTCVGAIIAAASGIWMAILAYKRARGATKSVA